MKRKIAIMYGIIFMLIICGLGMLSIKNLVNFYVNDEVDYNEWSADLGNKFETDIATTFWEKFQFVNINGLLRRIVGQREMNGVVKLNNGYLLTTIDCIEDDKLQKYSEKVADLDNYLKKEGIHLV